MVLPRTVSCSTELEYGATPGHGASGSGRLGRELYGPGQALCSVLGQRCSVLRGRMLSAYALAMRAGHYYSWAVARYHTLFLRPRRPMCGSDIDHAVSGTEMGCVLCGTGVGAATVLYALFLY
eukprot:930843-Rhodomonas_salina.3